MKEDQKNFLIFAVIAAIILFAWEPIVGRFFPTPPPPVTIEAGEKTAQADPRAVTSPDTPATMRDRAMILAETPRVAIETPRVRGSLNLRGARIDDLVLLRHAETIAEDSNPIRLLSPSGAENAYFASFGWSGDGLSAPGPDTVWTANGDRLTPETPITLSTTSNGRAFRMQISVDDGYMFTVRQIAANTGSQAVSAAPFAYLNRHKDSADPSTFTIHSGPVASYGGTVDYGYDYDDIDKSQANFASRGGWVGFTDIYWLAALVPDQGSNVDLRFRPTGNGNYQALYQSDNPRVLQPGQALISTSRFFAGAKEVDLLDRYEAEGIPLFGNAIDWGWFGPVEKPIFHYLDWLFRLVGNFGLAIILLTFTIRLIMFPIAQKQFASFASMRAIQPKMKALQERYKEDKPRLQQEMMKLYKDEKVNPLAGCLPTLLQIPIFYALYKVLMLTIEMRHQPFVLWIQDLSAPDPLTPLNLFGLLPFTPPSFLHIGVFPIMLGISMWAQFKLNPAPMDEIQKQVFALMPWVLMFVMAPFAVGLQVYWITSNLLTIAQQKWLYSRHPALKAAEAKPK
ncbi:membrane protein insertase YidC [Sphingomonas aestuarii]